MDSSNNVLCVLIPDVHKIKLSAVKVHCGFLSACLEKKNSNSTRLLDRSLAALDVDPLQSFSLKLFVYSVPQSLAHFSNSHSLISLPPLGGN